MSVLSDTVQKCRKSKRCDQCGCLINSGEDYRKQVTKDGDFSTYNAHIECDKAANALANYAGLNPGYDEWPVLKIDLSVDDFGWVMQDFPAVAARFNIQGPVQAIKT